jgi:integrase
MEQKQSKKLNFTRKIIDSLPAHNPTSPSREGEFSEADPSYSGLRILVSKTGRKSWLWRFKYQGVKKSMALGEYPAVSIEVARQRVLEGKALLAKGINPATEKDKAVTDLTFREFADQHYMPHARQHKLTWDDDLNFINRHINPFISDLLLSGIKPIHVAQVHSAAKDKLSPISANHVLKTLKRMLNLAVRWELLEKNPATHQERFHEGPLRERYLDKDKELPRFLKALGELEDRLSVAALRLLLYTGCRREEIVSIQWENFHKNEGRIFIKKGKNGLSRTVHLNEKAMAIMSELKENKEMEPRTRDSSYVFPSRDGANKPYLYDLRKTFAKACQMAKIENFRIHDLRHTFASMAVSSGADLYTVQKLLGHLDLAQTQRYSHLAADDLKRATENVSALFDRAA